MDASAYKKHTHREHILELPDTYIGSTDTHAESRWVFDETTGKMVHRPVQFNPGFYKLFDEIIVNARDALVRSQTEAGRTPIKHIDVTIQEPTADKPLMITVENDGDGIPVEMHPTEKVWAPELIFGAQHYTTMIDVWSLGCVLLEMLNGAPLFVGESSIDHLIEVIKVLGTPTKTQVA